VPEASNANDAPKANTGRGNRLLWIVAGFFLVQVVAWSVFLYFAHKTKVEEVPLQHRSHP
jgi:hypothetical protein